MKKQSVSAIFLAAIVISFVACNSKPTADNYLKYDNQRKDIVKAMVQNQTYMTELMNEMMNNDSCKQMMMDKMMTDPSMNEMHMNKMMSMCKADSNMCKMMMGKTMEMCDADPSMCKMMMGSMQPYPNVMKSVRGMSSMDNMK